MLAGSSSQRSTVSESKSSAARAVLDLEAGLAQPVRQVVAVDPDVVLLAEGDHPVERRGDRGVLVGRDAGPVGDQDERQAAVEPAPGAARASRRGRPGRARARGCRGSGRTSRPGRSMLGDVEPEVGGRVQVGGDALDRSAGARRPDRRAAPGRSGEAGGPGRSPRASSSAIARWRGCERQRGQMPPQPEIRRRDMRRKRPPQQGHSRPSPRSSRALSRAFASAAA